MRVDSAEICPFLSCLDVISGVDSSDLSLIQVAGLCVSGLAVVLDLARQCCELQRFDAIGLEVLIKPLSLKVLKS